MSLLTWRSLACSTVAGLAFLAGLPSPIEACCGWWGGGWGASYQPYSWGAGYQPYYAAYPSYYGYGYSSYAPNYGGCSSCGSCGSGCCGYAPACCGCSSCGPSCGCSSCGPSCGAGCYGGLGCSNCSGGGCGVTNPAPNSSNNPPRPEPDDGFRSGEGTNGGTSTTPSNRRNPRTNTFAPDPAASGSSSSGSGTPRSTPSGRSTTDPDAFSPERDPENRTFEPRSNKKEPMPTDAVKGRKTIPPDNDSFETPDDSNDPKTKTNRPDLGAPANGSEIIPSKKKPAPVPEDPTAEGATDSGPDINLPPEFKADDKSVSAAVAPKSRLALRGQFGKPSVVRLAVKPTPNWIAAPQAPVLAKH